jgi:prophage regulatory protein
MTQHTPAIFIRLSEVEQLIGLKRTAIYKRIKDGEFPAPVKVGKRASRWSTADIEKWAQAKHQQASAQPTA